MTVATLLPGAGKKRLEDTNVARLRACDLAWAEVALCREQLRPAFLSWPFDTWDAVGEHLLTYRKTIPQTIPRMSCSVAWMRSPLQMKEEQS